MVSKELVDKAKEIATEAHEGQKRIGGLPYIIHPEAVAGLVDTMEEKVVAWLHDVLEDTDLTEYDLIAKGIPSYLVEIVKILTRKEGESYFDYILRCLNSNNEIAIKVKIADLTHNFSDLHSGSLRDKYMLAKYILEQLGGLVLELKQPQRIGTADS